MAQQLAERVHEREVTKRHVLLLEPHDAARSGVERGPRDDVLLPGVGDGREPWPSLRCCEPLTDARLVRLVGVEVPPRVVEVAKEPEVDALLAGRRRRVARRRVPRAGPHARLADVRGRGRAGAVLVGEARAHPARHRHAAFGRPRAEVAAASPPLGAVDGRRAREAVEDARGRVACGVRRGRVYGGRRGH